MCNSACSLDLATKYVHKVVLYTCMHSYLVTLEVIILTWAFNYVPAFCILAVNVLVKLHVREGLPESLLLTYLICTKSHEQAKLLLRCQVNIEMFHEIMALVS